MSEVTVLVCVSRECVVLSPVYVCSTGVDVCNQTKVERVCSTSLCTW